MARNTSSWNSTIELMRMPVAEMGAEPENAWRFTMRVAASFDLLLTQLRRAMGLSHSELQAVLALWDGGRMTMTDMGRRVGMSRAAITTLADRLEQLGFVERTPDPGDRRRVLLAVTEKMDASLCDATASLQRRILGLDDWKAFPAGATSIRSAARDVAAELMDVDFETRRALPKREPGTQSLGW